jgi:hypothetical protein
MHAKVLPPVSDRHSVIVDKNFIFNEVQVWSEVLFTARQALDLCVHRHSQIAHPDCSTALSIGGPA